MAVFLAPGSYGAGYQAFDTNGKPLNGGLLYTYAAGTTSLQTTYTTSSGLVANANPIVLGTDGRPQSSGNIVEIWLTSGAAYKFTLTDSLNNQISVNDNLTGTNDIATLTEWINAGTPTYVAATQFTLTGNQTLVLDVGRRVKAVVTAGTIYGTVSAVAFSTVTTVTVDWDSTQLDSGLSFISYGFLDAANISIPVTTMDGSVETITAAATTDLSNIRSRQITISGNTGITRLSIAPGQLKFIQFSGTPTLSNGASLILPGAANITTAAGDTAIFRGEASSVIRCISYTRAATAPAAISAAQTYLVLKVSLNNTGNYFDIMNTGSIGGSGQKWLIIATFECSDTAGSGRFLCRIWDGSSTVFAESEIQTVGANLNSSITITYIASPAAAVTYTASAKDVSSTSGLILTTGNAGTANKASSITAIRLT